MHSYANWVKNRMESIPKTMNGRGLLDAAALKRVAKRPEMLEEAPPEEEEDE